MLTEVTAAAKSKMVGIFFCNRLTEVVTEYIILAADVRVVLKRI